MQLFFLTPSSDACQRMRQGPAPTAPRHSTGRGRSGGGLWGDTVLAPARHSPLLPGAGGRLSFNTQLGKWKWGILVFAKKIKIKKENRKKENKNDNKDGAGPVKAVLQQTWAICLVKEMEGITVPLLVWTQIETP